ncbi:MAG TPA: glycerophosphodiester phosphodiesterase [Dehalococcoidia bacterium]|nr:glycerophosphodiester phosphodiesterase [Dehalococcoidia bacterium]
MQTTQAKTGLRRPLRISHRGGGSLAPENSLEGIATALRYGVEMIEVDVRRAADGALVLSHDDIPHGGTRSIRTSSLEDLRRDTPHIATLDEALDAIGGRARVNLDIKDGAAIDSMLDAVRSHHMRERCITSCLDITCLARIAATEPGLPRFFSYPPDYGGASNKAWMKPAVTAAVAVMRATMPMRIGRMLRPAPGTNATIYAPLITRRLVSRAAALGIELYTWTVDDAAEMRRLAALGVGAITSNRPDLLAELYA